MNQLNTNMRRVTASLIYSIMIIMSLTSCEKKIATEGKTKNNQESIKANNNQEIVESKTNLSFDSYTFAENLKNDNFFESDNIGKVIELKDVGIKSYIISDNEVTLGGVFYNKQKNMAIPYHNYPPGGGAFIPIYYDKLEIKYNEEYKRAYSAGLIITLRDPKSVKKLKMYLANEPILNYEYQIDGGIEPEYRSGFIDLVNIKGTFKGYSVASSYPDKIYEIENAEIK